MGYEIGDGIECQRNGKIHIELSSGLVQFWTTPEMIPVMSLKLEEAIKVWKALDWGLPYYCDVEL